MTRSKAVSKRNRAIEMFLQAAIIALISTILLEMLVAMSLRNPRLSPIPISLLRYMHIRFDRNVIQVMPECATYDSELTYTLRPGRCTFASREFRNEYRINTLGLRDDESSLAAPHTVMLGDSFTMGWGVNQEESFPSVFERLTGHRTLNAGVSSYGTVRELRMLQRIDRSALANVVIQYSANDVGENSQLVEHPPFRTLSRERYERTIEDQARLLQYFPGKYAFNVLVQLKSAIGRRMETTVDPPQADVNRQASLFTRVLERSPVDLGSFRVAVLSVDASFVEASRRAVQSSSVEWVRRIKFVDASPIGGVEDAFYLLDDHPTALGHAFIAGLLVSVLDPGSSASQPR